MRRASLLPACAALFGALACPAVFGFDLPADLPSRAEGLWRIERTETLNHGDTAIAMEKIWNVCLDARADRAVHMLELYEQRASVAGLGVRCEAPQFAVAGNDFSWTMQCAATDYNATRTSAIRHMATFDGADHMQAETSIVNRGGPIQGEGRFIARMERIGACESGMQPGDMLLMHWRVNGEETLKGRQKRTVNSEIEHYKARTLSGHAR